MFSHIVLGGDDIPATWKFHDTALATPGRAASVAPGAARRVTLGSVRADHLLRTGR